MGTGVNTGIRVEIGSDVTVDASVADGVGLSADKRVGIGVAVGIAPPQPRIITKRNNRVMGPPGFKGRRNRFPPLRLRSGLAFALPQRRSPLHMLTITP